MSTKEAKEKALNKYYESNRKIGINVSNDVYKLLEDYCIKKEISKRELIESAILFYIDNH
ncbi:MAG: hypothetical protein OSJ54_10930 [Oscillospiraceae bacterium]|nr:hypothetical protein [Oscillospiraceae bacterium]